MVFAIFIVYSLSHLVCLCCGVNIPGDVATPEIHLGLWQEDVMMWRGVTTIMVSIRDTDTRAKSIVESKPNISLIILVVLSSLPGLRSEYKSVFNS